MSDRGIKKWNAYKSLVEQQNSLERTSRRRTTVEKPKISEEKAEEINELLTNYNGQEVEIKFYRANQVYSLITTIKKIDPYERSIITNDKKIIRFSEIFDIESI